MSGISEDEVIKIRNDALQYLTGKYGSVEIIDNYNHENVPENAGRLWHLGTSIRQMEEADAVYFCDGNIDTNGCKVERLIVRLYGIKVIS